MPTRRPKRSLSIGLVALAAAMMLPVQAQADHENRYFGFGYQPYGYAPPPAYYPPPVYYPPPGVRETAPGVYEYEVAPGHWVRVRPGYGYQPRRERRARTRPREQQPDQQRALRTPGPPPVPQSKPEVMDEPATAVRRAPERISPIEAPERAPAQSAAQQPPPEAPAARAANAISCEAAADIVRTFGFSDVQSTSCSGDVYGFDAARDGSSYAIELSAADGELTQVRKR